MAMKAEKSAKIAKKPVNVEGAEGVAIRVLISKEDGAPTFAMRLFELEPGGATPLHAHPWEHEVFVLAGSGAVWREGADVPVEEGTAVFVPAEEKHCFKNTGTRTMRFLCMVPVTAR